MNARGTCFDCPADIPAAFLVCDTHMDVRRRCDGKHWLDKLSVEVRDAAPDGTWWSKGKTADPADADQQAIRRRRKDDADSLWGQPREPEDNTMD